MIHRFFWVDLDGWFSKCATADEARREAEAQIETARDKSVDGWSEDDLARVCWGHIEQTAEVVRRDPAPEGCGFDEIVDYGLRGFDAAVVGRDGK